MKEKKRTVLTYFLNSEERPSYYTDKGHNIRPWEREWKKKKLTEIIKGVEGSNFWREWVSQGDRTGQDRIGHECMVGTVHTVRSVTYPTLPPVLSVRSNRTDSRNGMCAVRMSEALFVYRKELKEKKMRIQLNWLRKWTQKKKSQCQN